MNLAQTLRKRAKARIKTRIEEAFDIVVARAESLVEDFGLLEDGTFENSYAHMSLDEQEERQLRDRLMKEGFHIITRTDECNGRPMCILSWDG